ncbi:MAG: phosphoglycolate phosphatase [Fusobacteriaceae bacterium]|jgi:phosphoglycolate phosphatase|nr:phosphoglycolate phosphatase [Fusobacteriaceae bacterium]
MNYRYVIFDLDGTLTDPMIGITKSVAYSLKKLKGLEININELTRFIGPPLKESYMMFYGMTESESEVAIQYYREYFKETGILENEIYEGIEELLVDLKSNGLELMVATSKPTVFAEVIVDHFGIGDYFSHIVGSNLDGTRVKKAEVIEEVLKRAFITNKEDVIMIGDREHDIIGANQVGIDSIGVEYGYGSKKELMQAGANHIVENIRELRDIILT